jgi:hypothetical protein
VLERKFVQLGRVAESDRIELAVGGALQRSRDRAQRRGEAIDDAPY